MFPSQGLEKGCIVSKSITDTIKETEREEKT